MKIIEVLFRIKLSTRISIFVISILYLIVSFYLYEKYGIKIMNDSPRYLGYASNLSNGFYFDPLNFWYISYVFFVYVSTSISESLGLLIFNQYLFGFIGVLALFAGTLKLTKSLKTATRVAVVFILFPDNLMWCSYVLTESFYVSSICICFYFLMLVYKGAFKKRVYVGLIVCLLVCFFAKPTSPALFLALIAPSLFSFLKAKSKRFLKLTGVLIAGVVLLFLANKMISSHHVILIYKKGDIIFAMHEFPSHPDHDLLTLDIPEDLYVPSSDGSLLVNMGSFVFRNPLFFAKLMIGKVIMYVSHIRPYWSWSHNLLIVVFLWGAYFFSFIAIRRKLISDRLIFSALAYFAIHTLVVAITWVDWDGRFFVPLIPIIVVLGGIGMMNFFEKRFEKLN